MKGTEYLFILLRTLGQNEPNSFKWNYREKEIGVAYNMKILNMQGK